MSIFEDKTYNNMDELSQMIAPFDDPRNQLLSLIPDNFVIDVSDLIHIIDSHIDGLSFDSYMWNMNIGYHTIFDCMINKLKINDLISDVKSSIEPNAYDSTIYKSIISTLSMEIITIDGKEPIIDLSKPYTNVNIVVTKKKTIFNDKDSTDMIQHIVACNLNMRSYVLREVSSEVVNNILDVLEIRDKVKSMSKKDKISAIRSELVDVLTKNKWNIRSLELIAKICRWVTSYINDGYMPGYINLCTLKVKVWRNRENANEPIYSIAEVQ